MESAPVRARRTLVRCVDRSCEDAWSIRFSEEVDDLQIVEYPIGTNERGESGAAEHGDLE